MTAATSTPVTSSAWDQAYQDLLGAGYGEAAPCLAGRCQGDCTLFLDVDEQRGRVTAWIFDVKANEFIGQTLQVTGAAKAAVDYARHWVETQFAEEHLSGGAQRSTVQPAAEEVTL